MSEPKDMSCLHKRALLNQTPIALERLIAHGRKYESAGLVHDAVDFYQRAVALDRLQALMESARQDGDVFLFRRICRLLEREVIADEWLALATKAEALGKLAFARTAYREAGAIPDRIVADA